ncbi:hypothetical protein [Saccharibacillus deserti]|uniref:hypothetical protein n=1 Tax=Saccharibacillus deserti TaxID=1634444 RepID=UPI0015578BF6|nr:hypothetical protein [Saccharibacillus deserti]
MDRLEAHFNSFLYEMETTKIFSEDMESSIDKIIKENPARPFNIYRDSDVSGIVIRNQYIFNLHKRSTQLSFGYPSLLRQSLLIACMTQLELTLTSICEELKSRNLQGFRFSRKAEGSTIKKCLDAISRAILMTKLTHDNAALLEDLYLYFNIRNIMVHKSGYLSESNSKDVALTQQIERHSLFASNDILIDARKKIIISSFFSKQVIEDCIRLMTMLREIFKENNQFRDDQIRVFIQQYPIIEK